MIPKTKPIVPNANPNTPNTPNTSTINSFFKRDRPLQSFVSVRLILTLTVKRLATSLSLIAERSITTDKLRDLPFRLERRLSHSELDVSEAHC